MRGLLGLVLVGCGGDVAGLGMEAAPPPVVLEAGPLLTGERATLRVEGAVPGQDVWFAVGGGAGAGPCPALLGGACLGITGPQVVGRVRADALGVAAMAAVIPPTALAAPQRWFQAAQVGQVSNPRPARVLAGGGRARGTWMWRDTGRPHGTATFMGDPAREAGERASLDAWGVGRVYESYETPGPAWPGGVAAWHADLHAAGHEVQLLLSENTWIEPANYAGIDALLQARIVDFHAAVPPEGRFDAVHLDVEPHGLPDWSTGTPAHRRMRLGQLVALFQHVRDWLDAHGAADVRLYGDLVVWADGLPPGLGGTGSIGWTSLTDRQYFFEDVCLALDGVSLMAYERASSASVLSSVAWERANLGCEVRVALEADVGQTWGELQDLLVVLGEVEDDGVPTDLHSWSQWREASAAVGGP